MKQYSVKTKMIFQESAFNKQSAIKILLKELNKIADKNLSVRISKRKIIKIEKLPF